MTFYYNLMHLILVKSISNQGRLNQDLNLSSFTFTAYIPTCGSSGSPDSKSSVVFYFK